MAVINNFPISGKKVSDISAATTPLNGAEQVKVVQGANDAKTTSQDLANLAKSQLGTASTVNTGTTTGTIPLIAAGNKLDSALINSSSETVSGLSELATQGEVDTGTDDARVITPLKLRNSSLATTSQKGVTQLSTSTEYFNKNSAKAIDASLVASDPRLLGYAVVNNDAATSVTLPVGDAYLDGTGTFVHGYNLLTGLSASNEARVGASSLVYKNISDATQSKYLQEDATVDPNQANSNLNKFLFPSNLRTYNTDYAGFVVRVRLIVTTLASLNANNALVVLRLLRGDFDGANKKIVDFSEITMTDFPDNTTVRYTRYFPFTYALGESDPFVTNGVRLDLIKSNLSTDGAGIRVDSVNISIQREI